MIKRCDSIVVIAVIGVLGIAADFAMAETYSLKYPQGYGCAKKPDSQAFGGYYKTSWRAWPGETRLDKTFPSANGREVLPTPQGEKEKPLPKEKYKAPGKEEPSEEGNDVPPPGMERIPRPGLPPEQPAEDESGHAAKAKLKEKTPEAPREKAKDGGVTEGLPPLQMNKKNQDDGTKIQGLPDLPKTDPKEFNPIPGLPSDLKTPDPINVPDANKSGMNGRANRGPALERPSRVGARYATPPVPEPYDENAQNAPAPKGVVQAPPLMANWDSALAPSASDSTRSNGINPQTTVANHASYDEPKEASSQERMANQVVMQSYQETNPVSAQGAVKSAVAQQETIPAKEEEAEKAAVPAVAFGGYCPVELTLSGRWTQGSPQFTVIRNGMIFRMSGAAQRQQFLADPDRYMPGNGGNDPVVSFKERRTIPGQLNYCAAYKGRIYMFATQEAQAEFQRTPEKFAFQR